MGCCPGPRFTEHVSQVQTDVSRHSTYCSDLSYLNAHRVQAAQQDHLVRLSLALLGDRLEDIDHVGRPSLLVEDLRVRRVQALDDLYPVHLVLGQDHIDLVANSAGLTADPAYNSYHPVARRGLLGPDSRPHCRIRRIHSHNSLDIGHIVVAVLAHHYIAGARQARADTAVEAAAGELRDRCIGAEAAGSQHHKP